MVDYSTIPASCQIPGLAGIYRKWLAPAETGAFVEVGAYSGIAYSNTYCFCLAGWRGLQIEPHPATFASLLENMRPFPNVACEQVACSDCDGEARLYDMGECSTLVLDENARAWGCREDRFIVVRTTRLDGLLERHAIPPGFEVLVVDVEGAELSVLAGLDLRRWRPRMAIVETHEKHPSILHPNAWAITKHFEDRGYCKVYADHINSIFAR